MNILIVSATENEVRVLKSLLSNNKIDNNKEIYKINDVKIEFLVSGIGMVFSVYSLLKKINISKYDFVINMGIAGAFNNELAIGSVVNVAQEEFGDLGIESKDRFLSLFDTKYLSENEFPFKNGIIVNPGVNRFNIKLPQVNGVTVNTSHGNAQSISKFKEKFDADIETMEGAAVFYVCLLDNIPFLQIRAVSNYVTERNINEWKIPLAIENLNNTVFDLLNTIE